MVFEQPRLLIDGQLVPASSEATYDNINPADETVLGQAADASAQDAQRAVSAARVAFDTTDWNRNVALRQRCLTQLQDALRANLQHIYDITVAEVGCPRSIAEPIQVDGPIDGMSFMIDLAGSYQYNRPLEDRVTWGVAVRRSVLREPVGVVSAITPWNYPLMLNLAKVLPALAAGCTVVLKAAPDTPWTAAMLGRLVAEHTGFPPGVINILTSSSPAEVGEVLIDHPDIDAISFTGSTATGRHIMQRAARTIKRVFLELGGKSAAVALPDADIDVVAAATVSQAVMHSGQGCAATTRLLVHRDHLGVATQAAEQAMNSAGHGDPNDPSVVSGPLINARQREKVTELIESGKRDATLVVGGEPSPFTKGFYVAPALFTDVPNDCRIAREEIFGPVLVITGYETEAEALALANDSIYGLAGAVYSADITRAQQFAAGMNTGNVSINGAMWIAPDSPFGGHKQSGIGSEHGVEG
ncbi:MAG: aldehyde dehydrogenase family protein, partial [Actinomycetota bacterium]|nr:aldehyde dehydrogenase family protein [Actinomycetota bacterium]